MNNHSVQTVLETLLVAVLLTLHELKIKPTFLKSQNPVIVDKWLNSLKADCIVEKYSDIRRSSSNASNK